MPNLGFGELIIILLIVLLVFGANRLPQVGEGMGKAIRNLKRGLSGDDDIDVTPTKKHVSDGADTPRVSQETKQEVTDAKVVDRK
ncbi:MAG: twin-arginine translocase TatA/TatE family subunit [Myxococcales bacterium]|nr:twin-arginine translocase TatA/TatE family subunit [Myxococcales bacterium]